VIVMTLDNIIHIITILFGAGGVFSYYASVRRVKAQNVLDVSTAWEKFSTPLMKRLEQLEKKVNELEGENSDLRDWATRLYRQVLSLGEKRPEQFIRYPRDGE
jgi:IS1 family transposase